MDSTIRSGAPAHLCYSRVVMLHVSAHPVHVALKHGAGEDIGSEVAIAALGTTEGHGNVQAKRHSDDYRTFGRAP